MAASPAALVRRAKTAAAAAVLAGAALPPLLAAAAAAAALASAAPPPARLPAACVGEVGGQRGGAAHSPNWLPLGLTGSAGSVQLVMARSDGDGSARLGPTGSHWIKSCGVWGDAVAVAEQAAAEEAVVAVEAAAAAVAGEAAAEEE